MANPRPAFAKDLAWRLEALAFDLFSAALRALPTDTASALGGALFKALGPLTRSQRIAERSLRLALPDLADEERNRILAAQWENFGRYMFEFPLVDRLTPAGGRVEIAGAERLAGLAGSGRPVVFISGHFSNFEVMAAVIVASGISCDITYRAANNPYVDARIIRSRRSYGVRLFAPKGAEGARDLLGALKEGRSVAMLNDQRYDGGVAAPFFGRPVMTNPAAVRLAMRFGTSIQPMSIQRIRGAHFRVFAHDPIVVADTGDRTADIAAGVAAINAFIEGRVRERPGEWWWVHKRWPAEDYAELEARGL